MVVGIKDKSWENQYSDTQKQQEHKDFFNTLF